MDIKLDFNPEEIASKLHEAIISSSFKEQFMKAASAEVNSILAKNNNGYGSNYSSIIQRIVADFMRTRLDEMLKTEFKETIDKALRDRFANGELDKLIDTLMNRISVNARDY